RPRPHARFGRVSKRSPRRSFRATWEFVAMSIDPTEAAASLQDVAAIERRTREAVFYAGSSTIFIMWGVLVACGYGLTEFYPRSAGRVWVVLTAAGVAP